MSNHNYYPQPSQSPFYAQQQQQQHQSPYPPNAAASPVSNYSNSPPQQQPPPIRPHTAAPYSAGGYTPPSATVSNGGGYYPQPPPSHQPQSQSMPQPPLSSQGPYRTQQGRPDFPPPQQQPRQEYPPVSAGGYSPDLPQIIANTHGLPPDVVQRLAEDLMRSIQFNQQPGGVAPQSGAPLLSQPVAPGQQRQGQQRQEPPITSMAPPPPPQGPHGHQPHHQQIPGAFPNYAPGGGPAVQEAAPAPAPVPPHHLHHQQRPSQNQHYGPPQGQSYFPPQPTPTSATAPPHTSPNGPPATVMRDDALARKMPHRQSLKSNATSAYATTPTTSTSSGASGKPKMSMDDGAIFYELWGDLVDKEHGKEPRPRERLINLLRETANYMIKERPVKESIVITPEKMVDFYSSNAVEKEPLDWKLFFTGRSLSSLSSIYRALNCEHFYMPPASDQKPCIPALTPRGFETWMFTQLMSNPSREAARIQKVVSSWTIVDSKSGRPFPKSIPRRCFPEKEDQIICDGWWRVWEEFPPDFDEESEDETLALPAPGNHHYGPPRDQMTPPEAIEGPFVPPGHRKKAPMSMPYQDDEEDRRHSRKDSKTKSPLERPRKTYGSESANPPWREEPNPRPILGEELKGRSNPPPRPHTSHGHHPSVDATEKTRSRQRDRSEYRHRHQSRHRSRHRRERSTSPDGDWSGSSGISARTPGSGDGPPLDATAPAPGPPGAIPASGGDSRHPKRLEDVDRVQREQRELLRRFGNQRYPENTYPDDFEEYRHPRDRDRERDDRRVAEYAYQDELERDLRRTSAGGAGANGGGSVPGDTRRSHHGGSMSRGGGDRGYYGR